MAFNSLAFAGFYLVVLAAWWGVPGRWSWRKAGLLGASWCFYASWNPGFLLVLVATSWIDFHLAQRIHAGIMATGDEAGSGRSGARAVVARRWLIASLALNLGTLACFKYSRFLWETGASFVGGGPPPWFLAGAVPLGVSFYTFHAISYVVDTYRGRRAPTTRFGDFALYVAFFPQLVAGPITRWTFFGPQLETRPRLTATAMEDAIRLLALGFLKKVVLADTLGAFVDDVYGAPWAAGRVEIALAVYAYAFQIYFDFSGYTDIACGLAGLLGFQLPENFRHPYLAENPAEFWRRWHIALSTWLRDYLYVGLGGNREGRWRTYRNLLLTMLLGGLWHGAAWTFVLWGGVHGVWLAVHRWLVERRPAPPRTPRWIRQVATFHVVALAWVPFRAGSLPVVDAMVHAALGDRTIAGPFPLAALVLVLFGLGTHALAARRDLGAWFDALPRPLRGAAYGLVVVLVVAFSGQTGRFIYFEF